MDLGSGEELMTLTGDLEDLSLVTFSTNKGAEPEDLVEGPFVVTTWILQSLKQSDTLVLI